MEVKQFFCPSAFDMSFFGSADDIVAKKLYVDVKFETTPDTDGNIDGTYLEGMHLAMLINTREIEWYDDFE